MTYNPLSKHSVQGLRGCWLVCAAAESCWKCLVPVRHCSIRLTHLPQQFSLGSQVAPNKLLRVWMGSTYHKTSIGCFAGDKAAEYVADNVVTTLFTCTPS